MPSSSHSPGARLQAAFLHHGMMGWFTYAQHQRLKAARNGPELREVLRDFGWSPYGASDPSLLDVLLRWTRHSPVLPPDPLAAEIPEDSALLATIKDLQRQALERDAALDVA
ncbi:MAG: hypothetical protein AAF170_17060 [Bacteroidota bacterium]